MAKRTAQESDETRLKQKVSEKRKGPEDREGNAAFRSLLKRLKRTQRKRRAVTLRKRHATGKKGDAKVETPAGA